MSTKTSKRRQKRLNTNEEEDKTSSPKKIEEEANTTEEKIEEPEFIEEQNGLKGFESNGEEEEEMQPLILENEETQNLDTSKENNTEPEKPMESPRSKDETKEEEKSPVLQGRVTRRSQKEKNETEKVEAKKEESKKESEITEMSKVEVRIEKNEEIEKKLEEKLEERKEQIEIEENGFEEKITIEENKETTEPIIIPDDDSPPKDIPEIDLTQNEPNLTNASIFVNLNDTTKNFDITNLDDTAPSFLETHKDVSYADTLRNLSGRRTLRNTDSYRYKISDQTDARKSYVPRISSVKRKHTESPDDAKRFKPETESPGLMSYISSPINSFKRVNRSEIPSSTPKLTGYKFQSNNVIEDMSQIDIEEKPSKKWCSIM